MFEKEFYIALLLQKKLQNSLSESEQEELEKWLSLHPDNALILSDFSDTKKLFSELNSFKSVDKEDIFTRVKVGLLADKSSQPVRKLALWQWISIAAAVVVVFFGISFFYLKFNANSGINVAVRDIVPGSAGATLTLANGNVIRLSNQNSGAVVDGDGGDRLHINNGELIYLPNKEDQLTKAMIGKQNVLSTSNGQTYGVVLPDGTRVWLNAGSRLEYPVSFHGLKERMVNLNGEAYFEVTKDREHPFVVDSRGQKIVVLGTHFNVNTYSNENISSTSLFEGSISLQTNSIKKIIKPGEQAINQNNTLLVVKANTESVLDWRSGEFYFDNVKFKTALRKLERWYDIEFIYDQEVSDDMMAGGWISKNNKLSVVLALIERSGQVSFRIEGKKVFVTKL